LRDFFRENVALFFENRNSTENGTSLAFHEEIWRKKGSVFGSQIESKTNFALFLAKNGEFDLRNNVKWPFENEKQA
jgi:hypothetical protein